MFKFTKSLYNKINYSFINIENLIETKIEYTNLNLCSKRLSYLNNQFIFSHKPITPIYIGNLNNKLILLDGHYRLEIYKKNKENNYLINNKIPIVNISIDNIEEFKVLFEQINNNNLKDNLKMEDVEMEDMEYREIIINNTYSYFIDKYSNSFKFNGTRRPYLCQNKFLETIELIYDESKPITNDNHIINILEKLNNKYKNKQIEWFPSKGKINNQNLLNKIKKNNMLYFGMFPNEWHKHINNFPKINSENKISQSLRQQVWFKYSNNQLETKCNCCGINSINAFTFECGHIIPASKDGKCNIDNLVPICSLCNKSMGNINMITFMQQHNYPINKLIKS